MRVKNKERYVIATFVLLVLFGAIIYKFLSKPSIKEQQKKNVDLEVKFVN